MPPLRAAPPATPAGVKLEPVTREEMIAYLADGCKPREQWRIGTEHEKFGFQRGSLEPIGYDTIRTVLNEVGDRFDWEKIYEGENVIALKQGGQSVTLEPGGQLELSGAPLETVHQTCAEVNSHLYQVKAVSEQLDIAFLGAGFQPKIALPDVPIMPKGRYEIMRNYMPKVGSLGRDMMFRTCTIQVNLDFESEQDMVEKMRIGIALQPVATALFANSPFTDGKPNGFLSYRSQIWTDTDPDRTGQLPFVFDESFGFERWVDYILDVPMYFAYRDGKYVDCAGQSFRDFMAGKLEALPGERPTMVDYENHLTVAFPEVRLKRYIEMRGTDGGPWRRICALPALWVGLLYDREAQAEALALTQDITLEEMEAMRLDVAKLGLKAPFRGGTVQDIAREMLSISKGGLQRRGFKEASFLKGLEATVETGETPADQILRKYRDDWGESVDPLFAEQMF